MRIGYLSLIAAEEFDDRTPSISTIVADDVEAGLLTLDAGGSGRGYAPSALCSLQVCRYSGLMSDRGDGDVGVTAGETGEVGRVVSEHHASTEPDCCRHDQRIDGQFAASACRSEQVTGNSSGTRPRGDDLSKSTRQDRIDGGVGATTPVQLDEHGRGHTHRKVPLMGAAHRRSHTLMTLQILVWSGQHGQRFAVKD